MPARVVVRALSIVPTSDNVSTTLSKFTTQFSTVSLDAGEIHFDGHLHRVPSPRQPHCRLKSTKNTSTLFGAPGRESASSAFSFSLIYISERERESARETPDTTERGGRPTVNGSRKARTKGLSLLREYIRRLTNGETRHRLPNDATHFPMLGKTTLVRRHTRRGDARTSQCLRSRVRRPRSVEPLWHGVVHAKQRHLSPPASMRKYTLSRLGRRALRVVLSRYGGVCLRRVFRQARRVNRARARRADFAIDQEPTANLADLAPGNLVHFLRSVYTSRFSQGDKISQRFRGRFRGPR